MINYADVIVDLQMGDTGKGKVCNTLSQIPNEYTHVVRYNGGGNAGHTIYVDGKKLKWVEINKYNHINFDYIIFDRSGDFGSENTNLPVTDWLTERVLSLPIHTEFDETELAFITTKIIEYLR